MLVTDGLKVVMIIYEATDIHREEIARFGVDPTRKKRGLISTHTLRVCECVSYQLRTYAKFVAQNLKPSLLSVTSFFFVFAT